MTATENALRWSAEKAWDWYRDRPWIVGCNFVPSTAVNDVEMWQRETFDIATIDRELGLAEALGFNSVRVFLNFVVWEAGPDALKDTIHTFLNIAENHGQSVIPILLDDCFNQTAHVGPQDPPIPGVHNSQWVASPGSGMTSDPAAWPRLERYVKDIVGSFAADKRVLAWEMYNEPTQSLPLVQASFAWARSCRPSQPLTATLYSDWDDQIAECSDIISFHSYRPLPEFASMVSRLERYGRPLFCTEWMSRTQDSLIETHLPFMKEHRIAAYNWGLVCGKTQTHFPWGSAPGSIEPDPWFHDLFLPDGAPKYPGEIEFIKECIR